MDTDNSVVLAGGSGARGWLEAVRVGATGDMYNTVYNKSIVK